MKNCINTKFWFMSTFIAMLLVCNVTQTDAQRIKITKSDPDGDHGDKKALCVDPGSNVFEFYVETEIPNILSIDIISVASMNIQGQAVKVSQTYLGPGSSQVITEYVWKVEYDFIHNIGFYANGINSNLNMEIWITHGQGSNGSGTSLTEVDFMNHTFEYCDDDHEDEDEDGNSFGLGRKSNNIDTDIIVNKVYPNPTGNQLTMEIQVEKEQDISIQLLDQLGKVVKTVSLENKETEDVVSQILDISDLATGIYYLSVSTKDNVYTEKIVKL